MIRFIQTILSFILLFIAPAFAQHADLQRNTIIISGAFTRATLPNAPVGGGYMRLENTGGEADRLVSVISDAAAEVQIHEMIMQDDIMQMRSLPDGLDLPAGEVVDLAPGSYHLMFMGIRQPFVEGTILNLTLNFEKAGAVNIKVPILGAAANPAHGMGH